MLIPTNSALRRFPARLDPEQVLCLDGIRFAADIASVAYEELVVVLRLLVTDRINSESDRRIVRAIHFAWSIVDAIDRLRSLVKNFPGWKEPTKLPEVSAFLQATEGVREVRNLAQHLDRFIPHLVKTKRPVWGSLSGMLWVDQDQVRALAFNLIGGSIQPLEPGKMRIQIALPEDADTETVALHSRGRTLNLGDLVQEVQSVTAWLDTLLKSEFSRLAPSDRRHPVDLFFVTEVRLDELRKANESQSGGAA